MARKRSAYAEKLLDPRWQKMRLEILQRDGWACRTCGDTKATLHVHHTYYAFGRDPWEYEPESLITLCEDHHALVTESGKEALQALQMALGALEPDFIFDLAKALKTLAPEDQIELVWCLLVLLPDHWDELQMFTMGCVQEEARQMEQSNGG